VHFYQTDPASSTGILGKKRRPGAGIHSELAQN
jgi:hypothetical protein